ncbi:50S ribosomal protein L31 [Nocardia testacea]|uniref:50S ribosomal protein L31 n=1 Tax=Nocardia testacea TaxID=248551 RepID=UPI0033CCAAA9
MRQVGEQYRAGLPRGWVRPCHTIQGNDGNTYPVVDVEISSASHPFYTGTSRVVDTAGRGQRFERRYGSATRAGR